MVGVASRMKLRPALSAGRQSSSSSSGGRSTTIRPSTPAAFGVGEEALDAVDVDRIVVAHQHDRRGVVALAKVAHHGERLDHVLTGVERAQAGGLDRRTVGHRIGERHAEFDHVGAGLRQRLEDRERGLAVGIARHGEGHERGAAFARQLGEAGFDAGGHFLRILPGSTSGSVSWLRSRISAMRMLTVPSMMPHERQHEPHPFLGLDRQARGRTAAP